MTGVVFAETLRRHLTSGGYLTFLVLVAMSGIFVATFNTPGSAWPALITMLAITTGSAILGPEFSTGALQLIVSKPVARHSYVFGRVGGVFASVSLAAIVACSAEMLTRIIVRGVIPIPRLLEILAGELIVSLAAIALLTFLGSVTTWYFNAAIYVGAIASISIVEAIVGVMERRSGFLGSYPEVGEMIVALDDTLFPPVPLHLTVIWLAKTAALIGVALALACLAFQRREVPYGAD